MAQIPNKKPWHENEFVKFLGGQRVVVVGSAVLGVLMVAAIVASFFESPIDAPLSFRTGYEKIVDTPAQAQVVLCVEITSDKSEIDKAKLEATIRSIYETQSTRTGFKHHRHPTHVAIRAYTTGAAAAGPNDGWAAMLIKVPGRPIEILFQNEGGTTLTPLAGER